jgi:hypothetical protein
MSAGHGLPLTSTCSAIRGNLIRTSSRAIRASPMSSKVLARCSSVEKPLTDVEVSENLEPVPWVAYRYDEVHFRSALHSGVFQPLAVSRNSRKILQ